MLPFYTKWLTVEDYEVTDIINVYASFFISIKYEITYFNHQDCYY